MTTNRADGCYLEIDFVLKPGKRREFIRFSEEIQGEEGAGHLRSTVYEDLEQPGHIFRVSEWESLSALQAYLGGDGFRVLVGGIRVLGTISDCRMVESSDRVFGAIRSPRTVPRSKRTMRVDLV